MELYNLVSFFGIFIIAFLAWLCSSNKRIINWRLVLWGIGIQLVFAFFIFVIPVGSKIFLFINNIVVSVLDTSKAGLEFLFGRLALSPGTVNADGEASIGYILAIQGLPTIIFFAALVAALYYLKVMPLIIRGFSYVFTKLMRVSGAEALSASSNIFVGVESALVIKPHLKDMTKSELTTILAVSMGTIASTVLAIYVSFLHGEMPTIAGHLISASVISAPAAVVLSKLIVPETETPKTLGLNVKPHYERDDNLIMAIINGSWSGLRLLGGIVSLLIAFLGILALMDLVLSFLGGYLNGWFNWNFDWTLQSMLGYAFYPITLILGVPPADAMEIARIIGERSVTTELVSFQHLAKLLSDGALIHPRSAIIASYALCGFAHIASLAIFVGGVGALAPERVKDLSRVGFRALLAATLACLMTGAVAGTFFTQGSILLGK